MIHYPVRQSSIVIVKTMIVNQYFTLNQISGINITEKSNDPSKERQIRMPCKEEYDSKEKLIQMKPVNNVADFFCIKDVSIRS